MADPTSTSPHPFLQSRTMHILLACAMGAAVIGYFVGTTARPYGTTTAFESSADGPAPVVGVMPATSYLELQQFAIGANAQWTSRLESLKQPSFGPADEIVLAPQLKGVALAARESRRAYNGAPPVVPHSIDQMSSDACLACHQHGLSVQDRQAAMMSHPYLTNCTQCHVEQTSGSFAPITLSTNSFSGKPAPYEGDRAWPGAPPVIPHTMHMRDNCLACHGPAALPGLRTTHPWRTSCTQCHAPSAEMNQHLVGNARFLPPLPRGGSSSE